MSKKAHFILKLAVAFAFIYAGISGFINPDAWIGYFPAWTKGFVSDAILINAWGIIELAIGFWILFGKKILIPSIIATLALAGIVVFNWNQMDVIFRDVSIALASLALVFIERGR
jgi:uncharacterized membrane protein YphA (DoxX/SURF4 family)